jgi:hypothetical protein
MTGATSLAPPTSVGSLLARAPAAPFPSPSLTSAHLLALIPHTPLNVRRSFCHILSLRGDHPGGMTILFYFRPPHLHHPMANFPSLSHGLPPVSRAFFSELCTFFSFASCLCYCNLHLDHCHEYTFPPQDQVESDIDHERGVLSEQFLHIMVIRLRQCKVPACKVDAPNTSPLQSLLYTARRASSNAQWSHHR